VIMSGPYGMQHLKNQYCSNCKRKKLEDRVKGIFTPLPHLASPADGHPSRTAVAAAPARRQA